MKHDKPTKDYIKGLKYTPPTGGPTPGRGTVEIPPAVSRPPIVRVGIPGGK